MRIYCPALGTGTSMMQKLILQRRRWKGWGGEIYFKKYGEIMMDVVDKKKARREAKKHIENELQDQL